MSQAFRVEHDFLGDKQIPAAAWWGVHTARAVENFPISGTSVSVMPDLIRAFGFVKKAAARANAELGVLDRKRSAAIMSACEKLIAGHFRDQFVVDVIQGGRRHLDQHERQRGDRQPRAGQAGAKRAATTSCTPSTTSTPPRAPTTCIPRPCAWRCGRASTDLLGSMATLRRGFEAKAEEFKDVLKIGRTQLQDAVPMTLGQEFSTYAVMIEEDEARLGSPCADPGNQPGRHRHRHRHQRAAGYADLACKYLAEESRVPVVKAHNLIEATQDTGAFVQLSGVLKRVATKLSKTCNDLRLLSSGPQAGFGDIRLPPRQAGSSIMPGKVNPVIPEVMNQVAFEVIGNDVTVTMASEAGQLQLNAFEPIIGWSLFKSIEHLSQACITLQTHCVAGIEANHELLARRVRESITLVTALNPVVGYEKAALIAKTAIASGALVDQVAENLGILTRTQLEALLVPEKLTQPLRPGA
jgi:aspartate ammonia-lyase